MPKKEPTWIEEVVSADDRYPMSPKLVHEVLTDLSLSEREQRVFLYMICRRKWQEASYAKEISENLDIAPRTVERVLKNLEDLGYIWRRGKPKNRVLLIAPPWEIYGAIRRLTETAKQAANVSTRHASNGAENSHRKTAKKTATSSRNGRRVINRRPKKKSQPESIQNRFFDAGARLTDSDHDLEPPLPRTLDELYHDFLDQLEARFGEDVQVPSALTGQNRGQWKNRFVDGLEEEEGLRVGTLAVRLIVWDWERVRMTWAKAYGSQPYPTAEAVWRFADRAIPHIETGFRGSGRGNDRGPSKFAQRFLTEEGGKTEVDDPENW